MQSFLNPSCSHGELSLTTDEQLDPTVSTGIKIKCEDNIPSKCAKRKLLDVPISVNKRFASIKKEPSLNSMKHGLLKVESPSECALHDLIYIKVTMTQQPRLHFKKTSEYAQRAQYNGIYFQSDEVDSKFYILLLELILKDTIGENCNLQHVQSCEKCKSSKREIINTNHTHIASDVKGIASIPVSLHEQSAHIFPDYNGGKIKENMKFFIRATLFLKLGEVITEITNVDSEGIKVVAQGKLKTKGNKIDLRKIKNEPAAVKQAIEKSLLMENEHLMDKVEQLERRISQLESQQSRVADMEVTMRCLMDALKSFGYQMPKGLEALLSSPAPNNSEAKNPPEVVEQQPEGAINQEFISFDDSVLGQFNLDLNLEEIILQSSQWTNVQQ